MFCTTIPTNINEAEILEHFYPGFNNTNGPLPSSYTLNTPFRLLFVSMNDDNHENSFTNTYIDSKYSMYIRTSPEEVAPQLAMTKLHKHDFYEFMFVLDGKIYVTIENQRHLYETGSSCILNRNVMHAEEYHGNFNVVFLQIQEDFLNSIYQDFCMNFFDVEKLVSSTALVDFFRMNLTGTGDMEKDYVDFIPQKDKAFLVNEVHAIFDSITKETLNPTVGSSINIKYYITKLFRFLSISDNFSTIPIRIGSDAEYVIYTQIVSAMTETYGRISRSQLSEKLNYSGAYLNEITKKYSGLSLFDFGMTFCMKEAARLLRHTNENITDIGLALGFSNRTHFYQKFRETYDVTPAQYRRDNSLRN